MADEETRIIQLNGNGTHLSAKQKARLQKQNATVQEVEEIAVKIAEHYFRQTPQLVEAVVCQVVPQIVAQILAAHGIEMKAPPTEGQADVV